MQPFKLELGHISFPKEHLVFPTCIFINGVTPFFTFLCHYRLETKLWIHVIQYSWILIFNVLCKLFHAISVRKIKNVVHFLPPCSLDVSSRVKTRIQMLMMQSRIRRATKWRWKEKEHSDSLQTLFLSLIYSSNVTLFQDFITSHSNSYHEFLNQPSFLQFFSLSFTFCIEILIPQDFKIWPHVEIVAWTQVMKLKWGP